jgi:archaellum component FlaC
MRGLPEKDLYDSFNPTSPRDVQVRPDGQGGFNSTNVQADPAEMYEAIIKNYRKENQNIGVSQALKNMKQESINDLATAIQNRQKNAEDLQSAISGGPEKTMAKCRSELVKNDYEISHLVTKLRQQTDKNDPVAKANANKQANDFITNRLNQLATQQNKTPEAFAAEYLQTQQKHNQTSIEIAKKRLEKVQGVNVEQFGDKDPLLNPGKLKDVAPEEATKMKKLYQDLIDTIVPLKYKTRVPGTQNKPIDYVKNYRPIEPAQATIDLVVKTAEIMDRLGSIKERIHKTSIPVELVDNLMNRIGEQYDKQILLIARRKYVGREFDSTTSQDRRRLWSLL